ncbi:MAG: S-methyl-5-thioribose-1-phosphate isomerase, partial [bacterium]|nr:S-methyl-5-thioribose-1-phosphate isomerase [bacterium]
KIKTVKQIPIEQRKPEEVRSFGKSVTAPEDIGVYNPSFDVTPSHLVTAFITEKGVVKPPYIKNIPGLNCGKN